MIEAIAVVLFALMSDVSEEILAGNAAWRGPGRCGVNALYVLLRASPAGRNQPAPSYRAFASGVAFTEQGSSLKELQEGARASGFDCEMRKVEPSQIWRLPMPVLAHLETVDQGGAGHFVVFYDVRPQFQHVWFIDGATGQVTNADRKVMERMVTGYVLLPQAYRPIAASFSLAYGALAAGIGIALLLLVLRAYGKSRIRT